MKSVHTARERTRIAILEAMADVISETSGIGFSVQAVADRAGVTHRTVYNHFPTREALCEGFSTYVDELLAASAGEPPRLAAIDSLPGATAALYKVLALRDRHVRAYVMLMLGSRQPLKAWSDRTNVIERAIARQAGNNSSVPPRLAAAAVRMFVSSMGWHLLTEQAGLSTDDAAATCEWATRTLLEAATTRRTVKTTTPKSSKRGSNGNRSPRG